MSEVPPEYLVLLILIERPSRFDDRPRVVRGGGASEAHHPVGVVALARVPLQHLPHTVCLSISSHHQNISFEIWLGI